MEFLAGLYTLLLVTICLLLAVVLWKLNKPRNGGDYEELKRWMQQQLDAQAKDFAARQAAMAEQNYTAIRSVSETLQTSVQSMSATLAQGQSGQQQILTQRLQSLEAANTQKLEELRKTLAENMTALQAENAKKLDEITFDEMLELASLGAQVLNNRSVELAKKYNVELEVLSSLNPIPGTIVKEVAKMEKMLIRGVTKDKDVARISVIGLKDTPGVAFKIFSKLSQRNINVDIILQSVGRDGTKDITFTVSKDNGPLAVEILNDEVGGFQDVVCDTHVAKVSIVGAGMESHPGTASKMFEALYERDINIQMISTSEIKISVLVAEEDADKAVSAVHAKFIPND